MSRLSIPYNPVLKPLATKLRQRMTFSEVKLWNALKNGQMMDYDFDRQRPGLIPTFSQGEGQQRTALALPRLNSSFVFRLKVGELFIPPPWDGVGGGLCRE